jgi:transcriptional regulator with XRE-family HTH domain
MLGEILRKGRLDKGFKTLELARLTKIDGALISKFESGKRLPTLAQLQLFSQTYDLNFDRLKVQWIKEKILTDFENDTNLLQAISTILAENKYVLPAGNEPKIDLILEEMERLKDKLQQLR